MEKSDKPSPEATVVQKQSSPRFYFCLAIAAVAITASLVAAPCTDWTWSWNLPASRGRLLDALALFESESSTVGAEICPQYDAIIPDVHARLLSEVDETIANDEWAQGYFETFSGALQKPTVTVVDDVSLPENPGYVPFKDLHAHFAARFPLLHARLRKTTVNYYGLVFEWPGENPALKPMLLTGHQDVVPVDQDTIDQWQYPPFSGHNDGEWIYGRGAVDCKSVVLSQLAAIELLLEKGFKSMRTIVFAYGYDEEAGGFMGAAYISRYLEEKYGPDGFSFLLDEALPVESSDAVIMAAPAPAEKGAHLSRIEILTPGGHASDAPLHSSIGMMSAYVTELEDNRPPIKLLRESPYYQHLLCEAAFDPSMPRNLAALIKESQRSDLALQALVEELLVSNSRFAGYASTYQSISYIRGGSGPGQIPEDVELSIAYLTASYDAIADVDARLTALAEPVANKYNLSLESFGTPVGNIEKGHGYGHMSISRLWNITHDPSPVSPTFGDGAWMFLAGTIKSSLLSSTDSAFLGKPVVVAPTLCVAITDSTHYMQLTRSIYRYHHIIGRDQRGVHTVDEAIRTSALLEMVRFAVRLIVNSESPLLEAR